MYEVFENKKFIFMIMKYYENDDLLSLMKK